METNTVRVYIVSQGHNKGVKENVKVHCPFATIQMFTVFVLSFVVGKNLLSK